MHYKPQFDGLKNTRGQLPSKQFFADNSKLQKCETVDIKGIVSRYVESVVLMSRVEGE